MRGTEASLESRIAVVSGVTVENVRDVFNTYGLPLVNTPARPRGLRLHRLRVSGVRTGSFDPGPFDTTLRFSSGLTALVAANLKGKTSVLELITWCLRGVPRGLQAGVRHWLTELDLDVVVAGRPMGFRLDLMDGEITSAVILMAPEIQALQAVRTPDPARDITPAVRANSSDSFASQVQALMMDRLDLQPLVNTFNETSTQTHGWPSYYGSIYLPAGGDKALLGDQTMSGLPGRLLQVFLDLPAAATLTRVRTAYDVRTAAYKNRRNAAEEAVSARQAEREQVEADLGAARARLAALGPADDGVSLAELAAQAAALARQVANCRDSWEELMQAHRRARKQRQRDEKILNDVTESATARLLFHGLDPKACPRCDQEIAEDRKSEERDSHACAVCLRPVTGDDETPEEVADEAGQRLSESVIAEDEAHGALEEAEAALTRLTHDLEVVEERLRSARAVTQLPERLLAQEAVLRLEGALSVFPQLPAVTEDPVEATTIKVLGAGTQVLEDDSKSAASVLFAEVNKEILQLGRRFGITALEAVEIDRAARLRVVKDGGVKDWFGKQSAGERLRLRIAVVIALLRVGAKNGISTHPGLLLIDSPKAEEVQDLDAHTLLRELFILAAESDLQVLITTADSALARDVLRDDHILEAADSKPLW
ncbi:ATP-binding protein [Streptomyces sp. V4I2]|uniref:ATP-binding protein n=1 Tax=Streptomyces sp. V4I2 TaxID=3042280 RepID=UPI00278AD675|nr:ATP-binding protein [Streptomyces sp. V4I2]MDQ1045490.1 hypothetical protein [Streptomyces sp. V4I2]